MVFPLINLIPLSSFPFIVTLHSGCKSDFGRDSTRCSHQIGRDQRLYITPRPVRMTCHLPFQDAWSRARNRYIEDLTHEEKQFYMQATPEMIFYDASAAEKRHETSSTTRGLIHKLQPFVAAIEQYGQALDVYSNAYPLALSPLWGSIRVLLLAMLPFTAVPTETLILTY